ncbi:MAG: hypothetical protein KIT31_35680, partial [Deltaproteobacteria bacterium]|nr:hypothetical protein [Deltaproteobacteria bacterium]
PAALTGYLAACEHQLGLAAGAIAGAALRDALAQLGPGAIAIAADGPPELFDAGDLADPCLRCAQLVENLAADGLSPGAVAPGVRPKPVR